MLRLRCVKGSDDKALQLSYKILRYLEQNPNAEDSLRGITEWWLVHQMIEDETLHVQQALDELVSKQLIRQNIGPDNQIVYRINGENFAAVKAFLNQGKR